MAERIVVTGLGAVSALGLDADENWARGPRRRRAASPTTTSTPGRTARRRTPTRPPWSKGDAVAALEAALGRRVGALARPVRVCSP